MRAIKEIFSTLLPKLIQDKNLVTIMRYWDRIDNSKTTYPKKILANKTLLIGCHHQYASFELRRRKVLIIQEIASILNNSDIIIDLKLKIELQ